MRSVLIGYVCFCFLALYTLKYMVKSQEQLHIINRTYVYDEEAKKKIENYFKSEPKTVLDSLDAEEVSDILDSGLDNLNKILGNSSEYNDNIFDLLDSGLINISKAIGDSNNIEDNSLINDYYNIFCNIYGIKSNKIENKKTLDFAIYMPENLIADISMKNPSDFYKIKGLILEMSYLLDYGAIAYFKYEINDDYSTVDNINMSYSNNLQEIEYTGKTNLNDVKGFILQKELYLDDGAIYYMAYKF